MVSALVMHWWGNRGPAFSRLEFLSLQHLADELQGPSEEFGWRCDLTADQHTVFLSRCERAYTNQQQTCCVVRQV